MFTRSVIVIVVLVHVPRNINPPPWHPPNATNDDDKKNEEELGSHVRNKQQHTPPIQHKHAHELVQWRRRRRRQPNRKCASKWKVCLHECLLASRATRRVRANVALIARHGLVWKAYLCIFGRERASRPTSRQPLLLFVDTTRYSEVSCDVE